MSNLFIDYTYDKILASALSRVPSSRDRRQGSIIYDALAPACYELALSYIELQKIADKLDVNNLIGDELTRFTFQRTGLIRYPEAIATGFITINGMSGELIKAGYRVSNLKAVYKTTEDGIIGSSGNVTIPIISEEGGSVGNTDANTINTPVVTQPRVFSVTNNQAIVDGRDIEDDNSIRDRYYAKLRKPGKAGNVYHYLEWARAVPGVGDAKVYPAWDGPLTVKVVVVDSTIGTPDADIITRVEEAIERERPFGATVTVEGGVEVPINISAQYDISDDYNRESVLLTVKDSVIDYFKEIAFKQLVVNTARIGAIIISTPGVLDYSNLKLNGTTTNITLPDNGIPVIGTVTEV